MPGIKVGTTPLAVKEALTLLASEAEMPRGEHACLSLTGAAKLAEAVSNSETIVVNCMMADEGLEEVCAKMQPRERRNNQGGSQCTLYLSPTGRICLSLLLEHPLGEWMSLLCLLAAIASWDVGIAIEVFALTVLQNEQRSQDDRQHAFDSLTRA